MRRLLPNTDEAQCRCGHARAAHRHLRRGSDCSLCPDSCPRFRLRLASLLGRGRDGNPPG